MKKQNMKRILSLSMLIMAVMLFWLLIQPLSILAVALDEDSHTHNEIAFTEWTSTNSLPTTAGNYYLAGDVTISSTWEVPSGTTNLCLNGHGIKKTGTGSVVYVGNNITFNLYDCDQTTEHKFTVSDPAANGAGLAVVNDAATGEGVMTFTGGYITGGNANPYGGGVRINRYGKFNMYGGTIIGNKASSHGGGISVSGADLGASNTKNFVMSGGAICYNTAGWGGGIGIYGEAYISGNGAIFKNIASAGGAGIELESAGKLYLEGGSITENLLSGQNGGMWKGAGVHLPGGAELHIKGAPQITNNYQSDGTTPSNVFVRSGLKMTVDDALAEDAKIGVAMQNATGAFTSGWNTAMGNAEPKTYFSSDNGNYIVLLNDNEAQIGEKAHEHDGITFTKWASTNSLPTTAGNYYLAADVTISSTWEVPSGTVNLCLNDHKIAYSGSSGSVIRINNGSALNLYDCGTTVHYYYIGAASTYNSNCLGAIVASESDTNYVNAARRGSFVGGYITGGYGTGYSGSTVFGGGVFVDGGTFVLNGGCIFGNRLSVRDGGNGGGGVAVRKTSSSFTMNGGYIIGNHAGRFGGGIRIDGGSFTMNGGEIRHNTANTPGSGGAGCGGGLHLGGLDGGATVTITGGIIEGNYAGLKDGRGGGINVAGGTLTMTGGTVVGNNATLSGGGVNGSFSLNGNVTITGNTVGGTFVADSYTLTGGTVNNVYLPANQTITIADSVTTGANVGVTLESTTGKFTTGWNAKMGNAEPKTYFSSDNGSYGILLKDNEAQVGIKPHEHNDLTFTKWESTNSLPTTAGNYYLAADVTISSTWEVPSGTTNLCLNGHGIKKTGTGSVIKVGEGRTLKLYDCDTTTEHRYSISSPASNGAGVATVNDALTSNYQTFTGGYITGGYITGGYQYGAGINLEGNGATLYMYGGTIIGNRLTAGSTGGGGVCVQDWDKSGGFYMCGGSIIGNTSNYGGGVYVRTGRMELIGGTISKNVANGNIGGGVLVFGGGSTLEVKGGAISNNTAVHGGAVEVSGDGTVIISGGSFTNNLATGQGGALTNQRTDGNTSPASFSISGAPVFSGNTAGGQANDFYLCNTAVLNLTAALTNTTKIGIKKASTTGTFTSGWSTYMVDGEENVLDPADYFVSNNGSYVIKLADGEAKVAPPHTHSWSYTVNGNVITATCTGSGTCDLTSQTVTITATGKTYDGTAVTATVTKSDNWDAYGLAAPGTISYSGNTSAGTHTASVTVSGKTASAAFTIGKAPLTVTATAQSKTYGENDPALTYTVSGLVGTDTLSGELSRAEGEKAGIYAILQGTLTASDNYILTYIGADLTINKAIMTVTASGAAADYDGKAYRISVTAPGDATVMYGTKNGVYTMYTNPSYTNAGTYVVYYQVTKDNYVTVRGSETVQINPINVTVTITGYYSTVDYDGTEHTVSGYEAVASSALYNVAGDFIFNGAGTAARTDVGTTEMVLDASMFVNTNGNFANVTFEIVDGYQTIEPVDAELIAAPTSTEPVFNDGEQALVNAGKANGGTLYYALGADEKNAPDEADYQAAIPAAKEVGNYYIWYKVVGDGNHNDLAPACLKVTLAEEDWGTLRGVLYQSDGISTLEGAIVTLIQGDQEIDFVTTAADGKYWFAVPDGIYNLVVQYESNSVTVLVIVSGETTKDLVMPNGKTESILNVDTGDQDHFGVTVGGLDQEAYAVREADQVPDDKTVSVTMTVEQKAEDAAGNAELIREQAKDQNLEFFEIKVEKTVDSVATELDETKNVLEIVVPYENAGKKGVTVYSYHGTSVQTFIESDSKESGTFRVDKENGYIYIYTNRFSTYAIGYTPYYRVNSSLSLGSFTGTATVTLTNQDDGTLYTLKNVAMGNMSFNDIPSGEYVMTVTWTDGVKNTISLPVSVGGKAGKTGGSSSETASDLSQKGAVENSAPLTNRVRTINDSTGELAFSGLTVMAVATKKEHDLAWKKPEEVAMLPKRSKK